MTRYGGEILSLIEEGGEHLTVEQIYERLLEGGHRPVLATVYNNVNHMVAKGQIQRISIPGHPDRYDKNTRHDHLVCIRCGSLTDIVLGDLTESLQAQISQELLSYDLKLHYLCPACREEARL